MFIGSISLVTNSVGVTLIPDDCNFDKMNLAAGRVVILTSHPNMINVTMEVKVDGDKYMVHVLEDLLDSGKHLPILPGSKLSEAFEIDDSSQENSDSVDPYLSEEENEEDDYDSGSPVEYEGSAHPSTTSVKANNLDDDSRVQDVRTDQTASGDLDVGVNVFQGQDDANNGDIDPTNLSAQEDNDKVYGVIRSIDLNRTASNSGSLPPLNSFITPRSRSRNQVLQERHALAAGQTISQGSVSMEVQNTIAVGNLVGFEMSGFDNEVRELLVNDRSINLPK